MKALILAAGLGTRLRPLTEAHAKPALKINGIPSLWFNAWNLIQTVRGLQFAINTGHASETIVEACGDREMLKFTKVKFHFSHEKDRILGSLGALGKLRDWLKGPDPILVCNADTISYIDWARLLETHKKAKASLTMHVRDFMNAHEPYTDIAIGDGGKVAGFGEKKKNGTMFSGAYVLDPSLLDRIPEGVSETRPVLFEPLAKEGKLFAYRENCEWFDTGNIPAFAHVQFNLLKKIPRFKELVEVKMREVKPDCWIPRDWKKSDGEAILRGPAVLCGPQKEWMSLSRSYGPRFVGLEPPPPGMPVPQSSAIVMGARVCSLSETSQK